MVQSKSDARDELRRSVIAKIPAVAWSYINWQEKTLWRERKVGVSELTQVMRRSRPMCIAANKMTQRLQPQRYGADKPCALLSNGEEIHMAKPIIDDAL